MNNFTNAVRQNTLILMINIKSKRSMKVSLIILGFVNVSFESLTGKQVK